MLARAYLADEDGHQQAIALLADPDIATVTGTWTRIEISGALVRAARSGRADEKGLLAMLDADLVDKVTVLGASQETVEEHPFSLFVSTPCARWMPGIWRWPHWSCRRCSNPASSGGSPRATPRNAESPSYSASWRSEPECQS